MDETTINSADLTINEYLILREVNAEGDIEESNLYKISYKGATMLVKKGVLKKGSTGKYFIPQEHKHLIQDVRNKLGVSKI
jgi:hypothetical protein